MAESRTALAKVFRAAGKAHHQAFAATNGDDPDWPQWYAQHLKSSLSELLRSDLQEDVVAADLKAVDAEMRAQASAADWALYYADWFLARHST